MEKYKNRTVSLTSLIIGPRGQVNSLCGQCRTRDCGHDIKTVTQSEFGINVTRRLLQQGYKYKVVVECAGFSAGSEEE